MTDPRQDDAEAADDAFVRDLLGRLPEPAMPPDVAARIDAALAAVATAPGPAGAAATTVTPLDPTGRAGLGSRLRGHWLLSAAAVVAVLALGGAVVVGSLDRGSSRSSGTSDAVAAGAAPQAPGGVAVQDTLLTASGRGYTKANLGSEVLALVAGTSAGPTSALAAPGKALIDNRSRLVACLAKVEEGGPTLAPVAVDAGSFEGQPAVVVVLVGTGSSYDVFVVTPACSSADATLLYYASVRH